MSLHHIHQRKRASGRSRHPFPAQSKNIRWLDKVVLVAGIVSPAMMLPQLWLIYSEKNAAGIEPVSWISFTLLNIPWIIYGLVHKEAPFVLTYILWFITNALVFIGAVIY